MKLIRRVSLGVREGNSDKVYIVDRTRGILPGAPRLIQAGLRWDF